MNTRETTGEEESLENPIVITCIVLPVLLYVNCAAFSAAVIACIAEHARRANYLRHGYLQREE